MAEEFPNAPEHRPSIDRRRFLTSAALATTASVVPVAKPTETTLAETVQPLSPATEVPVLNVSAVTASRLAEIIEHNNLRKEVGRPLLSIPQELRRIKTAEGYARFATFSEAFRKRVQEKMLARFRRRRGNPNWKPNGIMSGMGFEYEVSRELRRLYVTRTIRQIHAGPAGDDVADANPPGRRYFVEALS